MPTRPATLPSLLLSALLASGGCDRGFADPSREFGPEVRGPADGRVEIHRPATLAGMDTPIQDGKGATVAIACETCHGPTADGPPIAQGVGDPEDMHSGLILEHGPLSCDSCHDADDRRYLHLADGRRLERAEAMELCAQCHGVQTRDYRHGSHGGMTGAWDLRRGDRVRNHCLDCHGAHAPAYPTLMPVLPPQDRGTQQLRAARHTEESHP